MRVFILSLVSLLLVASPAFAQSKKELAAQNVQLAQRLNVLENRLLTGDPAAERLMQRMDVVEAQARTLTGEVERLRYERETLQEEVRALAATVTGLQAVAEDMRLHLRAIDVVASAPQNSTSVSTIDGVIYDEGTSASGTYSTGSTIAGPPVILGGGTSAEANVEASNDMSELASIGREKMEEGNFSEAQIAFKQYLDLNPDASDRGDVYYWLGETHYVMGGYADAADAYIGSLHAAPKGAFAPEAMVRLASTARALGETEMSCQTLASFPTQYPNASASIRAKATLEAQRSGC